MPNWRISKIITDLIWETLKEQLRGKLRAVVEDKEQWDDISERTRVALLSQLKHKKVSHAAPKHVKEIKEKAQ
jgi:hypothetical protein